MEIIVVMIIAVAGWVVTHFLTIRAQNKAFLNQVLNQARIDIVGTLRDYQDWLSEVLNAICGINVDIALMETCMSTVGLNYSENAEHWIQKSTQFSKLFFSDRCSTEWSFRLIEYQILFQQTKTCIDDLINHGGQIIPCLNSFLDSLPSGLEKTPDLESIKKAIKEAQGKSMDIITEESALIYDLMSHLQNFCFAALTGNKIPERRPAKGRLRLAEDKDGNLRVVVETDEE